MKQVVTNAQALAESLKEEGIGLYTDGTDFHMVIGYADGGWTSPVLTEAFGSYRVSLNSIRAPGADRAPQQAFRIGTVAMTIRGFDADTFRQVGRSIAAVVRSGPGKGSILAVQAELSEIAAAHPAPSFFD